MQQAQSVLPADLGQILLTISGSSEGGNELLELLAELAEFKSAQCGALLDVTTPCTDRASRTFFEEGCARPVCTPDRAKAARMA
jgi:hypothetical protein